ncbi:MAG TPA: response regulator [Pyrinomonadaceae bacterium]
MICDDDQVLATQLVAALEAAGHEAQTCRHTMDMLREAAAGRFDLVALGLDMAGFGRSGAVEALTELAPHVPVIALHERPGEIMQAATQNARFAAVLPRTAAVRNFMYAVACALNETKPRVKGRPRKASAVAARRRALG